MLYTKNDIEKIYSSLVADYIARGARFDFSQNNYCCSEFDCHTDLLPDDGTRIIIYTRTGKVGREAFRLYDRGLCNIIVRICKPIKNISGNIYYPKSEQEEFTAFTFFQYKNIYTDDEEVYNAMNDKEMERRKLFSKYSRNLFKVKYNPALVLSIIKRRKGYKRTKPENILMVEKIHGRFNIYVNTNGKNDIITIG